MTRIAHLSDLHLVEPAIAARRGRDWLRVQYLSLRRSLDYLGRRARAELALHAAWDSGFDTLVLTGDLTEDGTLAQYEVLAEVLRESGIPPERIVLCPGNHDAYGLDWAAALAGPLAPWAAPIAWHADCVVVPVSSAVPQHFLRSSGRIERDALEEVGVVARGESQRAVVVAQHHPPFAVTHQWVHGLLNHGEVTGLLEERPNVSVLHGHIHRRKERGLTVGGPARIFSPAAVAEDLASLRVYEVADGLLHPAPLVVLAAERICAMVRDVEALGERMRRDVEAFGDEVLRDVEAIGEAVHDEVTTLGDVLRGDVAALRGGDRARK